MSLLFSLFVTLAIVAVAFLVGLSAGRADIPLAELLTSDGLQQGFRAAALELATLLTDLAHTLQHLGQG